MTKADLALLDNLAWALNHHPFAAALRVHGVWLSRPTARAMETHLRRLKMADRRATIADSHHACRHGREADISAGARCRLLRHAQDRMA